MPHPTAFNVGVQAASGRIDTPKPTLDPAATVTQFTITNYNPLYLYTLSVTAGTATRSAGTVTLNNTTTICTVTSSGQKGVVSSPSSFFERKPFSYSCRSVAATCCDTCCTNPCSCGCIAPGPSGCPSGSTPNGQCGCGGGTPCMTGCIGCNGYGQCNCRDCSYSVCDVLISETANGYINRGTEWYKKG